MLFLKLFFIIHHLIIQLGTWNHKIWRFNWLELWKWNYIFKNVTVHPKKLCFLYFTQFFNVFHSQPVNMLSVVLALEIMK